MLFFFTVGKPHQVRTLRVQRLLAAVPLCNAWPGAKLPSPCPCPLAAPLSALQAVKPAALQRARQVVRLAETESPPASRLPGPNRLGNGGARGGSFSAGFEGAFAAAVFASAAAFGSWKTPLQTLTLPCPPQELRLALHTSPSASASPAAARRASADSSGLFSPAGLVLEPSRSRLRDGDELARLLCRAFRLLALLLRRRWPWRCAGGAGTCGTVAK